MLSEVMFPATAPHPIVIEGKILVVMPVEPSGEGVFTSTRMAGMRLSLIGKPSPLMLTMIEWCRIAVKDCGSPGRIRTSDPTVNSRLLYRLSYRGVKLKPLLLSACTH